MPASRTSLLVDPYREETFTPAHQTHKSNQNTEFVSHLTVKFHDLNDYDKTIIVLDGPAGLTTSAILKVHPKAKILIVNKFEATCSILKKKFENVHRVGVEKNDHSHRHQNSSIFPIMIL